MKAVQVAGCSVAVSLIGAAALVIPSGCGSNDFLDLEDYQRDLLVGGLAVALLGQQADGEPPAGSPGRDGVDGVSCWDLNGNGQADGGEDANEDGSFNALDCQGPAGAPGADGPPGAMGLSCWDLNGDGVGNATEDANGDGNFDALDCQGPAGADGEPGSPGPPGPPGDDGPEFFDIFVDDFFFWDDSYFDPESQALVNVVRIDEPLLQYAQESPIAYRVAIPGTYEAHNDVTMRIFLYRTGFLKGDCFIMTVDARRLRHGGGIEFYEYLPLPDDPGRRWVHLDADEPAGLVAGPGTDDAVLVVLDLPLNTAPGLNYPNDLAGGHFLAFELNVHEADARDYQLLGVEFFESGAGSATLEGATVLFSTEDAVCPECSTDADCEDDDPCTHDTCDAGTCVYANNTDPCDDGDGCTTNDTCADGVCVGGPPLDCDDGVFCNGIEWCYMMGECMTGPPACIDMVCCEDTQTCVFNCCADVDCDDGDLCTVDTCDGGACSHVPIECPPETECVEGDCVPFP